jgi:septal ring factor EnvC (AmiA/AmiB activator)
MAHLEHNTQQLSEIEKGIRRLLDEKAALLHENNTLQRTIKQLTQEHKELAGIVEEFINRDKIGKIVTSITEKTPESEEMKQKLSEYIRILDRCIKFVTES